MKLNELIKHLEYIRAQTPNKVNPDILIKKVDYSGKYKAYFELDDNLMSDDSSTFEVILNVKN